MRGRALMNRGTTADAQQAIGAFEAATKADAAFAPAWAKLAEARHLLVMMGATRPLDAYPFARDEAARAVAADDRLADSYLAEGLVALWFDWNPAIAAARFERAIALNNSHAAARHDYAWALVALGRNEEAIREITMARDLDPVSVRANNDIGWLYLELGRAADAERACEHTVALDASALEAQACLERAYTQRGLWDAALAAARTTMPAAAFDALAARGGTSQDMVRALWQWRLERLEQAARTRWISPYTLAVQHVLVGNHDRAIDALERARDEKNGMLVFLARDPALDPLREHPRFRAFSARILGPSEARSSGVLEVRQPRNLEPRNPGTP
jgi:tetratricopeptide (TPR) repeat protein